MKINNLKTDVLIVGAGTSGMVAALCLAKWNVKSIIVERNLGVNEHPKAHELNTRSIEILESIGVSIQKLEQEASPISDGTRIAFAAPASKMSLVKSTLIKMLMIQVNIIDI